MQNNDTQLDWLYVVHSNIKLILAGGIICALIALAASFVLPKEYNSSVVIKVGRVSYFSSDTGKHGQESFILIKNIEPVETIQEYLGSEPFLAEVISKLKLVTEPAKLAKKIDVGINSDLRDPENRQLIITATSGTPEGSAGLAGAIANVLIARHKEIFDGAVERQHEYAKGLEAGIVSLSAEIEKMKSSLTMLMSRPGADRTDIALLQDALLQKEMELSRLRKDLVNTQVTSDTRMLSDNSTIIAPPFLPGEPDKPKPLINTVAGLFAGLVLTLAYAFYREALKARDML